MPIRNYPFTITRPGDVARPYLPVTIANPGAGKTIKVLALIDTGADECAFPASFAPFLGHDLQAGRPKRIGTGNGITIAWGHTSRLEIARIRNTRGTDRLYAESPDSFTRRKKFPEQFRPDRRLSE